MQSKEFCVCVAKKKGFLDFFSRYTIPCLDPEGFKKHPSNLPLPSLLLSHPPSLPPSLLQQGPASAGHLRLAVSLFMWHGCSKMSFPLFRHPLRPSLGALRRSTAAVSPRRSSSAAVSPRRVKFSDSADPCLEYLNNPVRNNFKGTVCQYLLNLNHF